MNKTDNLVELAWFDLEQKRGHLGDLTFEKYLDLKGTERKLAGLRKAKEVPVEDVIKDLKRYGEFPSMVMGNIFLERTYSETQRAGVIGIEGQLAYLATGQMIKEPKLEMGLISTHIPGSPGAGGWGITGTRGLGVARRRNYRKSLDADKWLGRSLAFLEDRYGSIKGRVLKNDALFWKINEMLISSS